ERRRLTLRRSESCRRTVSAGAHRRSSAICPAHRQLDHSAIRTMATATHQLTELAGQWRDARRLNLLYGALQQKFDLGVPPCPELESPINRAEPEALERVWNWFKQMDERVHVHQLRQLLQTTRLGTEENLRAMITRHLEKENKVDADRDKV